MVVEVVRGLDSVEEIVEDFPVDSVEDVVEDTVEDFPVDSDTVE